ncbi:hypothetical protein XPA_007196 [Xanthoria parietina]
MVYCPGRINPRFRGGWIFCTPIIRGILGVAAEGSCILPGPASHSERNQYLIIRTAHRRVDLLLEDNALHPMICVHTG